MSINTSAHQRPSSWSRSGNLTFGPWGPKVDVQYLRIYVRQLRQKLEERPDQPRHILTETGVGYRLQTDVGLPEDEGVLRTDVE